LEVASRKFLVEGFVFANDLRLTSYDLSLIFKNSEEVKKVIHAGVDTGEPVFATAGRTMGFDCIKLIYG